MLGSCWRNSLTRTGLICTDFCGRLTESADRKSGSGRKRTVCTRDNIDNVELLVVSQEDAPGTYRTMRQVARETGITTTSVHRIVHKDLKLQCFKKRRAQELTEANKIKRLVCVKQLLRKYPEHAVSFIWFTDEKQFTVQPPVNLQNDRVYAPLGSQKRQVSAERLLRTRSTFSKSVMVSVAVSILGTTEL